MGNIGIVQLLIVAVIIVLLFGTKKLRNIGGDLGGAIKGFKKAMSDDDKKAITDETASTKTTVETDAKAKTKEKEQA